MRRVSWTGAVLRCAALALAVGLVGACGLSGPEGPGADPLGSAQPTDASSPEPGGDMPVDEYCAEYPGEVDRVRAEVTAEGVVLRWADRGPGDTYAIDRRPVGSQKWVPVAYWRSPRSELRYVDTVPRFGESVEYRVQNGLQCEGEPGANTVTLLWDEGDGTGGRPEFCEVWATPITDVTAQLVASGLVVEVTWRDTEDPPPGTAYLVYSRAPGAQEWYHEDQWRVYLREEQESPSFTVSLRDYPSFGVGSTYGVSRAAVCDPETLDGATAEVTEQGAEED